MGSLACKCIFHCSEHNAKGEGPHGTELWRSWNAEMKYTNEWSSNSGYRVICLIIMFTQLAMVVKMSKIGQFCIFCWCQQKSHSLGKIFTWIWKILFRYIRKCYGLLNSELPLARYQSLKKQIFIIFCWLSSFLILLPLISQKKQLQNLWTISFSVRTQKYLLGSLFKCFP